MTDKELFKKMVLESNIKELLENTREFLDKIEEMDEV